MATCNQQAVGWVACAASVGRLQYILGSFLLKAYQRIFAEARTVFAQQVVEVRPDLRSQPLPHCVQQFSAIYTRGRAGAHSVELRPPGCGHVLPVVEVSPRKPGECRCHAGQEERDRQPAHALFPPKTPVCCRVTPGHANLCSLLTPNNTVVHVPFFQIRRLPALLSARMPDLAGRGCIVITCSLSWSEREPRPPPPPSRPLGRVTGANGGRGAAWLSPVAGAGAARRDAETQTQLHGESERERETDRERERERRERKEGRGDERRERRERGGILNPWHQP